MNLDFGILWIEDSFSEDEERALRRRVHEAGFLVNITTRPNGQGIKELSDEHHKFYRFDFILLDYRLQDEDGDELAPRVRDMFPSTTILFYSGSVDSEEKLRKMIAEKCVEGVYCCHRARFIERTGALIDQTTHALNRLSGMRGLAMRVVAECDEIMKDSVLSLHGRDEDDLAELEALDKDVLQFNYKARENYELATQGSLQDRLDTRAVDSSKLFKHFRRLTKLAAKKPAEFGLSDLEVDRLRELRSSTSQYDSRVLHKRNTLGHVKEQEGPEGWRLVGSEEITADDFPALRQTFADHIDAFREIRSMFFTLDRD